MEVPTRRIATGLAIAVAGGSALIGCGEDTSAKNAKPPMTLQEHREADTSARNRFMVDYGGLVANLVDKRTGTEWVGDNRKQQCLAESPFGHTNKGVDVKVGANEDTLVVGNGATDEELVFSGYSDTSRRLRPADMFTVRVLGQYGCTVTDY